MEKVTINSLFEASIEIIKDCSLENGGIVAANSTKKYYPKEAKNYLYIWPRDASYACIACDVLGLNDIPERYFMWCRNNVEGFKKTGLFYEKYHPNGLKAGTRFQPDQTGTFLFAIWHHLANKNTAEKNKPLYFELIEWAAEGICNKWDTNHFTIITNDVWEERLCFPDLKENFSYSLAACIKGLHCANDVIPTKRWSKVAGEMEARLKKHIFTTMQGHTCFARVFGEAPKTGERIRDERIDASILGLVYPFEIVNAKDDAVSGSISEIEDKLVVIKDGVIKEGVHRYENDEYDGWMHEGEHRKKGGGAWPLLNFWLAIYFQKKGDTYKATQYYNWVLDRLKNNYIPEQMFNNSYQVSVSPLLWSHVMFIIATRELYPEKIQRLKKQMSL